MLKLIQTMRGLPPVFKRGEDVAAARLWFRPDKFEVNPDRAIALEVLVGGRRFTGKTPLSDRHARLYPLSSPRAREVLYRLGFKSLSDSDPRKINEILRHLPILPFITSNDSLYNASKQVRFEFEVHLFTRKAKAMGLWNQVSGVIQKMREELKIYSFEETMNRVTALFNDDHASVPMSRQLTEIGEICNHLKAMGDARGSLRHFQNVEVGLLGRSTHAKIRDTLTYNDQEIVGEIAKAVDVIVELEDELSEDNKVLWTDFINDYRHYVCDAFSKDHFSHLLEIGEKAAKALGIDFFDDGIRSSKEQYFKEKLENTAVQMWNAYNDGYRLIDSDRDTALNTIIRDFRKKSAVMCMSEASLYAALWEEFLHCADGTLAARRSIDQPRFSTEYLPFIERVRQSLLLESKEIAESINQRVVALKAGFLNTHIKERVIPSAFSGDRHTTQVAIREARALALRLNIDFPEAVVDQVEAYRQRQIAAPVMASYLENFRGNLNGIMNQLGDIDHALKVRLVKGMGHLKTLQGRLYSMPPDITLDTSAQDDDENLLLALEFGVHRLASVIGDSRAQRSSLNQAWDVLLEYHTLLGKEERDVSALILRVQKLGESVLSGERSYFNSLASNNQLPPYSLDNPPHYTSHSALREYQVVQQKATLLGLTFNYTPHAYR